MNAASLIKKVSKAIKRVGPMARTAYLRVTVPVSGDQLTGVNLVTTTADTLFAPQPVFNQLGKREAMYLSTPTLHLVADDYEFTFPAGQASKAMFQAANAALVLQDANGYEGLRIKYVDSVMFGGKDVVITVVACSVGFYAPPSTSHGFSILLENGSYLLQEDGSGSLLE